MPFVEIVILFLLILINGFLSMSELAVVSARRARLQVMVDQRVRGARRAVALAEAPGRFLSTVQIGITLVGIAAGTYGGTSIALPLAHELETKGLSETVAQALAYGGVVTLITFFSLVLGELVPKQLGLRNPERVAVWVSPTMTVLARVIAPAAGLLDLTARLCLKLLGSGRHAPHAVTDDEIKALVAEAESAGIVEPGEKEMITGVMRLADRSARAMMTPRRDVDWIDLESDAETVRERLRSSPHSRLPVGRGGIDAVLGIIHVRELLNAQLAGQPWDIARLVRPAPIIQDSIDALKVLDVLRAAPVHMALVVDEYGSFEGVLTPADILAAIAGVFTTAGEDKLTVVQRSDGSWLIDGMNPADEMADLLGIKLPEDGDFHTVAGFVLDRLRRIPITGEQFDWEGWRFEVLDMDRRRVDKVLASRNMPPDEAYQG
jgi:putative hemolysin